MCHVVNFMLSLLLMSRPIVRKSIFDRPNTLDTLISRSKTHTAFAMSKQQYTRLLSLWPKDPLRPTVSFQKALETRAANLSKAQSSSHQEAQELRTVGILNALLENRFAQKYPTNPRLLNPQSNPKYYEDLKQELEQAPTRSRFDSFIKKWKGFLRFQ